MKLLGETLLSRYAIQTVLGSGGFGDTYFARDMALPRNPPCVVKHLKPKNESAEVQAIAQSLFEREANILYELGEHESIPRLFAHFEQNGEFFLVQEFIEGHDLSIDFQAGVPWAQERVITLIRELLRVLSVLHEKNVIHRDIKPQNVMCRDQDGKLFLIDFGAVKEIPQLAIDGTGQTALTIAIGSPGYMPGEQAVGKPKAASDIYAVGIIAIQALTGQAPTQLLSDPNTGELLWPVPTQLSEGLASFLKCMTQDHFSQRYKNAMEALSAFEQILLGATPVQTSLGNDSQSPQKTVMPPVPTTEYQIPIPSPSKQQAVNSRSSTARFRKSLILPWTLALAGLFALGAGIVMIIQPLKGNVQVTSKINSKSPADSTVDIRIQRNQVESAGSQPPLTQPTAPPGSSTQNETAPQLPQNRPAENQKIPLPVSLENAAFVIDPPSNIRIVPNGEILCAVPSPQTIVISNPPQGDWYSTSYCGEPGVIHSSQLSFSEQQAWVVDPPSNVRSQPNGAVLCSVSQASQIQIYGQSNDWYRTDVCAGNIIGYIHNSQITFD